MKSCARKNCEREDRSERGSVQCVEERVERGSVRKSERFNYIPAVAAVHLSLAGSCGQVVVTGWTSRLKMDDETELDWTALMTGLGWSTQRWGLSSKPAREEGC